MTKSNYFNNGIHENSGKVRENWKLINVTLGRNTKMTLISELTCKVSRILAKKR